MDSIDNEKNNEVDGDIELLKDAFYLFDTKGDKKVNPQLILKAMTELKYENSNPIVYEIITKLCEKGDEVNVKEFLDILMVYLEQPDTEESLNKIFDLYDTTKTGNINFVDIKSISKILGDALSNEEIQNIIIKSSSNGEFISREEFCNIILNK